MLLPALALDAAFSKSFDRIGNQVKIWSVKSFEIARVDDLRAQRCVSQCFEQVTQIRTMRLQPTVYFGIKKSWYSFGAVFLM